MAHERVVFQAPPTPGSSRHTSFQHNQAFSTPYDETDDFAQRPLLPNRNVQSSYASKAQEKRRPDPLDFVDSNYNQTFSASQLYNTLPYQDPRSSAATDASFLNTPDPRLLPNRPASRYTPPAKHPFAKGFEPPRWRMLLVHTFLCILAYPALLLVTVLGGQNNTLYWARAWVAIGCGVVGITLGTSLTELARRYLEAATWATLIHQSKVQKGAGIRLRDLAASAHDPTSPLTGLRLMWNRAMYPGTRRSSRKSYDKRAWSFYIFLFLGMVLFSTSLPFLLGRIVRIDTIVEHQYTFYREIPVIGGLSDDDRERARSMLAVFNDFTVTWTLSPFSSHGRLPPSILRKSPDHNGDEVYAPETTSDQTQPNGKGFGTLELDTVMPNVENPEDGSQPLNSLAVNVESGSLLRYPRWGIRIHCAKIPEASRNIIPRANSTLTYVFTPLDTLSSLFSSFSLDTPEAYKVPLNVTKVMSGTDVLPEGTDPATLSIIAGRFSDNGVAHSFMSSPVSMGTDGKGFATFEMVLVRLNTTYAKAGTFGVLSDQAMPDINNQPSYIGYDAAICLELFEPWIFETYISKSSSPSTQKLIQQADEVKTGKVPELNVGERLGESVTRALNSTGMEVAYEVAHGNSVNQLLKDNGRDSFYVPSPTIISFTDGTGSDGYTELSAEHFGRAKAMADAENMLPYFTGSAQIVGRVYDDRTLANAKIQLMEAILLIAAVFLLGVIAALFMPKLPLSVPRRGFELYSWMAAFHGSEKELVGEAAFPESVRNMDLVEIKQNAGDLKMRYVF